MSATVARSAMAMSRRVTEFVERMLRPLGFTFHRHGGSFIRPRNAVVHDWIMFPLDAAHDGSGVFVTANLSIYCPVLDEYLDGELSSRRSETEGVDRPGHRNLSCFTRNIGHLLPEGRWRQWEVVDNEHAEDVLRGLAATLLELGLPWCERFVTLSDVREGFVAYGRRDHFSTTLPALDRLLGERSEHDSPRRMFHAGHGAPCAPKWPELAAATAEPLWRCDD